MDIIEIEKVMHLLKYKTEMYKNLIFNISDKAPLNAILKCINLVESGISRDIQEHIYYALMELINNSLRAHRSTNRMDKPITMKLTCSHEELIIEIKDYGGGFNPMDLPYDINMPAHSIDLQSTSFQKYRERHEYRRFGMGILTARKLFNHFDLCFHRDGIAIDQYEPHRTDGTMITVGVEWND